MEPLNKIALLKNNKKVPWALFDSIEHVKKQAPPSHLSQTQKKDFSVTLSFLRCYIGSVGTFNSYRMEIERLLHW